MIPISQYKFYDLGAKLHRVVANRTAVGAAEMFVPLMEAQTALDGLIKGDPMTLDIAKADANALLNKLGTIFNKNFIDMNTRQFRFPGREETIDSHELTLLRALVEKFETSLAAELGRKAVYAVPKRGLFDTYELTEHADKQFSEDMLRQMGDGMRDDLRAAGRCLAFGLGTACCFHLVRAVEAMLSRYIESFGGGASSNSEVLWKDGLKRLHAAAKEKSTGPDGRVLGLLNDIETRIRPILQNADTPISIGDATIFFGMTGSLITLMQETLQNAGKAQNRLRQAEEKLAEAARVVEESSDSDNAESYGSVARSKSA